MTKWKHNDTCHTCEAALLCMSGMIEPGTVVLLMTMDGDVEKYGVCIDYNLKDMKEGNLPEELSTPPIIFGTCPRLSKIYKHVDGTGTYFQQRLQGQPMNSPMEVML